MLDPCRLRADRPKFTVMNDYETLPRAPITEALIDIQVGADAAISVDSLARLERRSLLRIPDESSSTRFAQNLR